LSFTLYKKIRKNKSIIAIIKIKIIVVDTKHLFDKIKIELNNLVPSVRKKTHKK